MADAVVLQFVVRWADCDPNGHLANFAYLPWATHARFTYLESRGFPGEEFQRLKLGPVVLADHLEYRRELLPGDAVSVTMRCGGQSADGARFVLVNEFLRKDGKLAAKVITQGGWFDLAARKIVPPPPGLAEAMNALERTADFVTIEK